MAAIQARRSVLCGVIKEEEDYTRDDDHGNRAALDLDLCRAVGVAVLGANAKIEIRTFPDEAAAVQGLLARKIDLIATATPSLPNASAGLGFSQPVLYDGQSFLVPNRLNLQAPADLAGHKVCFLAGTPSDGGLRAYAANHHLEYIWYPFSELGEMEAAFVTGNCDAISGDVTQLANTRAVFHRRAPEFSILPGLIRMDPLAPAYRSDDPRWANVVNWTVALLIQAEESGVTRSNLASLQSASPAAAASSTTAGAPSSDDPIVRALLGQPHGTGDALGLQTRWGATVLGETGNYGEIFERDLGAGSPLKMERGMNRSWSQGGLMAAPPFILR